MHVSKLQDLQCDVQFTSVLRLESTLVKVTRQVHTDPQRHDILARSVEVTEATVANGALIKASSMSPIA